MNLKLGRGHYFAQVRGSGAAFPLKPQVPLILTTQSWGAFQLETSAFNLVLH
jgi:hypothetical protein